MPPSTVSIPGVADYDILVNGTLLSSHYKSHIVALTVETDTRCPGMFEIVISGSHYLSSETEWIDDTTVFSLGNEVEIKMGYIDQLQTVLIGEITGLEPEFTTSSLPCLHVRGYDRGHRLQMSRKTRTFTQQKDSDIVSSIAQEAGLSAEVVDSQVTYDYICQNQKTDMEFLKERARRINYEVVVEAKKLIFRPVQNDSNEVATLTMQNDLLEFFPRLSTIGQSTEVQVRGWSLKDKKEIIGKAGAGDESSTMGGKSSAAQVVSSAFSDAVKMINVPVSSQAEADQIAKAKYNETSLSLITGEGTCSGRTDLSAGMVIKIDGVGTRFSGNYYLTATTQRYRAQRNFVTSFSFSRSGL